MVLDKYVGKIFYAITKYVAALDTRIDVIEATSRGISNIRTFMIITDDLNCFTYLASILFREYYSRDLLCLVNFAILLSGYNPFLFNTQIIKQAYTKAKDYAKQNIIAKPEKLELY